MDKKRRKLQGWSLSLHGTVRYWFIKGNFCLSDMIRIRVVIAVMILLIMSYCSDATGMKTNNDIVISSEISSERESEVVLYKQWGHC